MSTSSVIQLSEDKQQQQQQPESLMDKLRHHYLYGDPTGSRSKFWARVTFLAQAVTQIYVTVNILMPFVFEDFHPWILYCLQVWACYMCTMSVANWLCVICYSNLYRPTRDRPEPLLQHFGQNPPDRFQGRLAPHHHNHHHHDHHHQQQQQHADTNGHVTIDVTEKGGLPWTYCQLCDMNIPPRAHHCKFCNACMLRRDHHCFLVGCCIGHWNQRYFVILAGYGMVVGYVGAFLTITYLRYHHPPTLTMWSYFFPLSFYQWVIGDIGGLQMLLILHAYLLCLFGPVCNIYFFSQLSVIAQGKTLYEVSQGNKYKVTSSVEDNVRLVFGEYWLINFLFPAQILFKQTNDGLHYEGVKIVPDSESRQPTGKLASD